MSGSPGSSFLNRWLGAALIVAFLAGGPGLALFEGFEHARPITPHPAGAHFEDGRVSYHADHCLVARSLGHNRVLPVLASLCATMPAEAADPLSHFVPLITWYRSVLPSRYVFVGQEGPMTIPSAANGDIHVVDVLDLAQPHEVAFYHMDATPSAGTHNFWMDEAAQILYAAYYDGGVIALDVSGALAGDLSGRVLAQLKPSATPWMWGVQLSGGSLYAIDLLNGLYQIRLAGTTLSVVSGGGNVPDRYSSDLWVSGEYAYTGTWGVLKRNGASGNAVKIWHLGPTGAPPLVDSIITEGIGTVSDVKGSADGRLLVFSAELGEHAGLYVYSLADPAHPTLRGRVINPVGFHTAKVAEIGGRQYVFAARNPEPRRHQHWSSMM